MIVDPMGARFRDGARLQPWQVSAKLFDFEPDFVAWICRYLEERKLPHGATDAKAWINKGFFVLERHELVTLQWEAYETKKREQPHMAADGNPATPEPGAPDRAVGDRALPDAAELTPEQRAANMRRLREMVEKNKVGG